MTINTRLKEARTISKLSQEQMAERLGISFRAYWNYETGKRDLTQENLINLAQMFNFNPTWLLLGKGPMFLPEQSNTMQPKDNEQVLKNYETFGHRLAELQDELGYLDKAMARIMGIDEKRYMRIKLGEQDATSEELARLASKVDVSLDWLIKG